MVSRYYRRRSRPEGGRRGVGYLPCYRAVLVILSYLWANVSVVVVEQELLDPGSLRGKPLDGVRTRSYRCELIVSCEGYGIKEQDGRGLGRVKERDVERGNRWLGEGKDRDGMSGRRRMSASLVGGAADGSRQ
jgi:hypothetical protein